MMAKFLRSPWFYMGFISLLLLMYTAYRAAFLSMTHDESHTFLAFNTKPVWPCFFSADCWETANNHLLNTLLMQFSVKWLGISELTIRLPNVLAHLVYLLFSIRIIRRMDFSFWPELAAFTILNFNPYLLDFFSLARGYGLSVAFLLGSVYFLQSYVLQPQRTWLALVGIYTLGFLAIMANFTALNFMFCIWGLQLFLSVYFAIRRHRPGRQVLQQSSIPLIFMLFLVVLLKLPISVLRAKGEFLYGAASAWDTLVILSRDVLYGQNYLGRKTALMFLLPVLLTLVVISWLALKNAKSATAPAWWTLLICSLGWGAFALMVVQHILLDSAYLFNRKAILFIPLFALMLTTGLGYLKLERQRLLSIMIIILLSWHMLRSLNVSFCREWWYDANTKTVMTELHELVRQRDKPVTLGTNWLFMPTAEFYRVTKKMLKIAPLIYDKTIQTDGRFEFYYLDYNDWPALSGQYQKIMEFNSGERMLVQKK